MAKVLILNGSPRLRGNTNALIESFKKGLAKGDNEIVTFNVAFMKIHDSIDNGGYPEEYQGKACLIQDDMLQIEPHLEEADVVVFASPLYFYSFSGYLKNVIDRLDTSFLPGSLSGKKLIVMLAFSGEDLSSLEPVKEQSRLIVEHLGWDLFSFLSLPGVKKAKDYEQHLNQLETAYQLGLKIH